MKVNGQNVVSYEDFEGLFLNKTIDMDDIYKRLRSIPSEVDLLGLEKEKILNDLKEVLEATKLFSNPLDKDYLGKIAKELFPGHCITQQGLQKVLKDESKTIKNYAKKRIMDDRPILKQIHSICYKILSFEKVITKGLIGLCKSVLKDFDVDSAKTGVKVVVRNIGVGVLLIATGVWLIGINMYSIYFPIFTGGSSAGIGLLSKKSIINWLKKNVLRVKGNNNES